MQNFYSREQLMTMRLPVLEGLDINSPEQQTLVQDVLNERRAGLPPSQPVYRKDVPDIKSPEQEAEWQEVINRRTYKLLHPEGDVAVEPVPTQPEEPIQPASEPTQLESGRIDLAEPTGEGAPITLNGLVSPKLRGRPAKKK